ncbi:hypothetical protein [Lysobacter sp. CA199]|uniref:hypothetical protein n=1 Tax=Lysobacter sp. CA199 TaxID=3455608 RepID=UPI003F8D3037
MKGSNQAAQGLKTPIVLFVACLAIYAGGVYLTRAYLCQPVGAWVLLAAVMVGALGCILLGVSAFRLRSLWCGVSTFAAAVIIAVMFLFIGVLTLPGCSGV